MISVDAGAAQWLLPCHEDRFLETSPALRTSNPPPRPTAFTIGLRKASDRRVVGHGHHSRVQRFSLCAFSHIERFGRGRWSATSALPALLSGWALTGNGSGGIGTPEVDPPSSTTDPSTAGRSSRRMCSSSMAAPTCSERRHRGLERRENANGTLAILRLHLRSEGVTGNGDFPVWSEPRASSEPPWDERDDEHPYIIQGTPGGKGGRGAARAPRGGGCGARASCLA
jgi:hypothetical protein